MTNIQSVQNYIRNTKKKKVNTRSRLDAAQTVKVYEALKGVLKPAEGGRFAYTGNLSDAKIADMLGVTEKNIYSARVKLFGKLKYDVEYVPYSVLLKNVDELGKRVAYLEEQLGLK